ncbi:glycoside hydrolase [Salibacterium aidingense]|uniref:glycoside hydrolase n=1 Tax=Salibacterium aidingense TaxID=384933 RepID=UPI003BCCEA9B
MIKNGKQTLRIVVSVSLAAGILYSSGPAADTEASKPTSDINWDNELQEIDGFGGSFAFHKAGSIYRLDEPQRTQILDMLFSEENGIGLDIVRNQVGDGGTWGDSEYDGPADTIMPEPGEFVWDDPDWETKKDEFDKYQIWLMKEAEKRGVTEFISSVWSAPYWMKENESVSGEGDSNRLREDKYQEFADYLAEYVLGYKEHFDIDISYISPTNEPDFTGGYSSSLWTPEELNTFVREYLGPTFEERDVPAEIVLGEGMEFTEEYAAPALDDVATRDYVDIVAAHAYQGLQEDGTVVPENEFERSKELDKKIWQTEYMNQGDQKQEFEDNTIDDAMGYANLIGNMFDHPGVGAYFWWWPAANSGADGSNLIRLMNDGSDQSVSPTETGLFRVFKRYYSFGNYSRFVEPGDVMIESDKHPVDDVMITTFKDPNSGDFSIMAVNNSSESQQITFDLNDFPEDTSAVVPYRTSASENLNKLDDIQIKDGSFSMKLKSSSVTSFIPKTFELPDLPDMKDVFSTYIAAENDGMTPGLQVRDNAEGEQVVTNIRNGSHIKYSNVNFGDGSANGQPDKRGILHMNAEVSSIFGGTIEVRLDDPYSGKVVGTMDVPERLDPEKWLTVSTKIDTNSTDGAQGFHNVYLVFKNDNSKNTRMFDVHSFAFSDEEPDND